MAISDHRERDFAGLGLSGPILAALDNVGYERPTPIQQASIPHLLAGRDLIGMAQTGTGKTAAFALPILSEIQVRSPTIQALVLCPTRELALQVAEAFQTYASHLRGFHVLPIYGGQDMRTQLRALKRPVHVVVATPGRLLDHLRRKTVNLNHLRTVVLDEADEMLRMGFADDVESILEQTQDTRRVALFSATMPTRIKQIADKYLSNPEEVRIKSAEATNENTEQFYWLVRGTNKLDALTRMLEVEEFDRMIVFVRTKTGTVELADKLNARGLSAAPLNGDMNQALRQRTVDQLKQGHLDILVATDVAARGLDVERVSHVINYDIPYDTEAYVHRIGRTGRAGRAGKAILFVAPRERRLLRIIEKHTRSTIKPLELPTRHDLVYRRSQAFKQTVAQAVGRDDAEFFESLVSEICEEQQCSVEQVAAALSFLLQQDRPLQPPEQPQQPASEESKRKSRGSKGGDTPGKLDRTPQPLKDYPEVKMERYRIAIGQKDQVTPREIIGAVANEAGVEGRYIGQVRIYDGFSTIDLPEGMPKDVFQILRKTRVRSRKLQIELISDDNKRAPKAKKRKGKRRKTK